MTHMKILPVPVLAEPLTRTSGERPGTERECPPSSGEARESTPSSTNDVKLAPLAPRESVDSRGGQKLCRALTSAAFQRRMESIAIKIILCAIGLPVLLLAGIIILVACYHDDRI